MGMMGGDWDLRMQEEEVVLEIVDKNVRFTLAERKVEIDRS